MNNEYIKKIGVLTSGGDAPGMNAAIRSVVRACSHLNVQAMAIRRGYQGLLDGDIFELRTRDVSETLQRGGTFLMTARCEEFMTKEGVERAAENARTFGLDAIVVIGGDGSFRGALALSRAGINVVCIPATIDNDMGCTEYTLGFDTALHTGMEAIDKLRDTAASHERCSVVQVMGRHAGYIALCVGVATGAEVILIPEIKYDIKKDVIRVVFEGRNAGKSHYIIVVAEGAGDAGMIAHEIEEQTGIESRATILGHLQRGGSPTPRDRIFASSMGLMAVECVIKDDMNKVIAVKDGKLTTLDIEQAIDMKKNINSEWTDSVKLLF